MDISRRDPVGPLGELATEAPVTRAGPLSLIDTFDLAIAELLGVGGAAPHAELLKLLTNLEADGLLVSVAAEPSPGWRWTDRSAVREDFVPREPDRARELESRLTQWYLGRGAASEAFAHALASQSWPLIADVIERFWRPITFTDVCSPARWC